MLSDREVELPWAAELGGGRKASEEGSKARPRRLVPWTLGEDDRASGPQRGGLGAQLFLEEEVAMELDGDVESDEGDDGDEEESGDDWFDDFDGMDECGDIVELGTP
jgi:hypothetical protein